MDVLENILENILSGTVYKTGGRTLKKYIFINLFGLLDNEFKF